MRKKKIYIDKSQFFEGGKPIRVEVDNGKENFFGEKVNQFNGEIVFAHAEENKVWILTYEPVILDGKEIV